MSNYEMKEIKTVAIIGLGALGILFAHHLSKNMHKENLRIIADSKRIEKYKKDPVCCNGELCSFNYTAPEKINSPADLVIFTVKFSGLESAIKAVRNQVGPHTVIISALNGISSENIIGSIYGMEKMLYCVSQGQDGIRLNNRLTYENMGLLCIGDSKPASENLMRVADFFDRTGFPYLVDTDMKKRLWGKFMLNVGVNQTVAVYEGNYGTVQRKGEARSTMIEAMREVIALSEKEGVDLTEDDLSYWLDVISVLNPEGQPSMRQDTAAGRTTEVELFSGTVLELGKKYEVDTPVNRYLYLWAQEGR
jgi:2-dehydropantoate 2-reductase